MSAFVTALGNLFKKPATVCYPFEPTYKPTDYRGLIEHVPEVCIWCRRCEIDCLSGAIVFSQDIEGQQPFITILTYVFTVGSVWQFVRRKALFSK